MHTAAAAATRMSATPLIAVASSSCSSVAAAITVPWLCGDQDHAACLSAAVSAASRVADPAPCARRRRRSQRMVRPRPERDRHPTAPRPPAAAGDPERRHGQGHQTHRQRNRDEHTDVRQRRGVRRRQSRSHRDRQIQHRQRRDDRHGEQCQPGDQSARRDPSATPAREPRRCGRPAARGSVVMCAPG